MPIEQNSLSDLTKSNIDAALHVTNGRMEIRIDIAPGEMPAARQYLKGRHHNAAILLVDPAPAAGEV